MSAQSFRIETVRTWRVLRSNGTSIHTTTTCGRSTRCKSITAGAKLSSGPEQNGGDAGTEGGRTEGGERMGDEGRKGDAVLRQSDRVPLPHPPLVGRSTLQARRSVPARSQGLPSGDRLIFGTRDWRRDWRAD